MRPRTHDCGCGCGAGITAAATYAPGHNRRTVEKVAEDVRFWEKVEKAESCWIWIGGKVGAGYGSFHGSNGRTIRAHRWSYERLVGPIPDGMFLDHLCRNRDCVNPEHLEPVTHIENVLWGISPAARNYRKTHCVNGHAFTPENTYITPTRNGGRVCRTCMQQYDRNRRTREREQRASERVR